MARHLMVDLETLDYRTSSVVLTLGAVQFDPFSSAPMRDLYLKIEIDEQMALGRTIDEGTIQWWATQPKEIQEEAFVLNDRIPLRNAMEQFRLFAWNCDAFWSNGAIFDIIILQDIFTQLEMNIPWQYWQVRDTRTLYDLAHPDMPQNAKHDALEDARRQAIGVRNCFKKLGYNGEKL